MGRIIGGLVAAGMLPGILVAQVPASGQAVGEAAPIYGVKIPPGYRDWRLISVALEEGSLNDLRAILGNDVEIAAAREAKLPYPDGTIIARLAWSHHPLLDVNLPNYASAIVTAAEIVASLSSLPTLEREAS